MATWICAACVHKGCVNSKAMTVNKAPSGDMIEALVSGSTKSRIRSFIDWLPGVLPPNQSNLLETSPELDMQLSHTQSHSAHLHNSQHAMAWSISGRLLAVFVLYGVVLMLANYGQLLAFSPFVNAEHPPLVDSLHASFPHMVRRHAHRVSAATKPGAHSCATHLFLFACQHHDVGVHLPDMLLLVGCTASFIAYISLGWRTLLAIWEEWFVRPSRACAL